MNHRPMLFRMATGLYFTAAGALASALPYYFLFTKG